METRHISYMNSSNSCLKKLESGRIKKRPGISPGDHEIMSPPLRRNNNIFEAPIAIKNATNIIFLRIHKEKSWEDTWCNMISYFNHNVCAALLFCHCVHGPDYMEKQMQYWNLTFHGMQWGASESHYQQILIFRRSEHNSQREEIARAYIKDRGSKLSLEVIKTTQEILCVVWQSLETIRTQPAIENKCTHGIIILWKCKFELQSKM